MWQENNQPTAVPFQSLRQWSLCHRKKKHPYSFSCMHDMTIKITAPYRRSRHAHLRDLFRCFALVFGTRGVFCFEIFARWGKVLAVELCLQVEFSVVECGNSQIVFRECTFVLLGCSDWQNCRLSKWVWLASWDQITVSVQRTGSSSQLGMKDRKSVV